MEETLEEGRQVEEHLEMMRIQYWQHDRQGSEHISNPTDVKAAFADLTTKESFKEQFSGE